MSENTKSYRNQRPKKKDMIVAKTSMAIIAEIFENRGIFKEPVFLEPISFTS